VTSVTKGTESGNRFREFGATISFPAGKQFCCEDIYATTVAHALCAFGTWLAPRLWRSSCSRCTQSSTRHGVMAEVTPALEPWGAPASGAFCALPVPSETRGSCTRVGECSRVRGSARRLENPNMAAVFVSSTCAITTNCCYCFPRKSLGTHVRLPAVLCPKLFAVSLSKAPNRCRCGT